jgi:hypothetical protein
MVMAVGIVAGTDPGATLAILGGGAYTTVTALDTPSSGFVTITVTFSGAVMAVVVGEFNVSLLLDTKFVATVPMTVTPSARVNLAVAPFSKFLPSSVNAVATVAGTTLGVTELRIGRTMGHPTSIDATKSIIADLKKYERANIVRLPFVPSPLVAS